jgi:hypothetical protein
MYVCTCTPPLFFSRTKLFLQYGKVMISRQRRRRFGMHAHTHARKQASTGTRRTRHSFRFRTPKLLCYLFAVNDDDEEIIKIKIPANQPTSQPASHRTLSFVRQVGEANRRIAIRAGRERTHYVGMTVYLPVCTYYTLLYSIYLPIEVIACAMACRYIHNKGTSTSQFDIHDLVISHAHARKPFHEVFL